MSVWDMYEEFADKRLSKTETGDERQIGLTLGIVEENYNKDMPGRLKVRIPVMDEGSSIVRWAKVIQNYSGSVYGVYFLPEKDDQVVVAYERGSLERAYVLGSVPRDNDRFISQSADEDNIWKRIVAKHGTEIAFEDCKDGDGEKDKLHIRTAKKMLELTMDNEKKQVRLADKEKKCEFILQTEDGRITLKAESKITIQAGDSVKITLNGDSGSVSVQAKKVSIQADSSLECKSNGSAKFTGQQTTVEASSMLKASSNGMVTVAGTPVKIG